RAPLAYALVGQTRDDAAGEAFDKVAKLLGLGFPGGPVIERTATTGDPKAITFPLAQMTDGAADFSFSGIKTSVSFYVKRHAPLGEGQVADIAASFQAAVVKMLVRKTGRAARRGATSRRFSPPTPPSCAASARRSRPERAARSRRDSWTAARAGGCP